MSRPSILDVRTLELLGLTPKDLEVYAALLRLGSAPLRAIAEEADLNRGTCYDALKRLLDVGLASYVDAKTHRYFTGEDPLVLRQLAARREVAIAEIRLELEQKTIPALRDLSLRAKRRPVVRYYEGSDGVRAILEDVLATAERAETKLYRVYSAAGVRDLIADAWPGFTRERIRRKVHVRAIALGSGGVSAEFSERRWITRDSKAPSYVFLYPGRSAHISADAHKNLFGVIVDDPALSATQEVVFDGLWETLG